MDQQPDIPTCKEHGPMAQLTPGTKEQAFCGTWYVCQSVWPRCGNSVLLLSPELLAQLDQQRASLAKTRQPQGANR